MDTQYLNELLRNPESEVKGVPSAKEIEFIMALHCANPVYQVVYQSRKNATFGLRIIHDFQEVS